jgi:hypothetical protein
MRKRIAVIVTIMACTISMLSGCSSLIKLKDQDSEKSTVQEEESSDDENTDAEEETSNDEKEDEETSNNAKEEKETSNNTKEDDEDEEHSKEFVVDESEYLSEADKKLLSKRSAMISLKYGFDIVMVVIDDYDTEYMQTYADDFYDNNGYSHDGLVLVLSMNTKEYYFSTSGKAIDNITDARIDDIVEVIMPYLKNSELYEAFDNYITQVEEIMGYDE